MAAAALLALLMMLTWAWLAASGTLAISKPNATKVPNQSLYYQHQLNRNHPSVPNIIQTR